MPQYYFTVGNGNPQSFAAYTPSFISFCVYNGTTATPPGITQSVSNQGLFGFSYAAASLIAFIIDAGSSLTASTGRYVYGTLSPDDSIGVTSMAIGNTSIALGVTGVALGVTSISYDAAISSTLIATGATLVSIGNTAITQANNIGTTLIAQGSTLVVFGNTQTAIGTALSNSGVTLVGIGNTSIALGTTAAALGVTGVAL